jgi:hypothetical protein
VGVDRYAVHPDRHDPVGRRLVTRQVRRIRQQVEPDLMLGR